MGVGSAWEPPTPGSAQPVRIGDCDVWNVQYLVKILMAVLVIIIVILHDGMPMTMIQTW